MRLQARPHLHYAPVPGGVYVSGARTRFVLRGSDQLYTLADICLPLLELGTTEDDLVAAVGIPNARSAVQRLTATLHGHDMLLDPAAAGPEPTAADRARYAGTLAYLEERCAEPYAVFARLRATTVLVTGPATATGPAARGLDRAGIGTVHVGAGATTPDVILAVTDSLDDLDGLPPGTPVVPVLIGERFVLAGPVSRDAGDVTAFARRAESWADATTGPARPAADALAGALAAHLIFEHLTGLAPAGQAYVVHGDDLAADPVVVTTATGAGTVVDLRDAAAEPLPDHDDVVSRQLTTVTARWTGLLHAAAGETLPQLPLALREARQRAGHAGRVVAWGSDQRSAAIGVTLDALRGRCFTTAPVPLGATGAAGLTERQWLLDGALRLLADRLVASQVVTEDSLPAEAARILLSLRPLRSDPLVLNVSSVPGVQWRLGLVASAATGETLGMAWAADPATALTEALGTALARAQVPGADGPALLRTDALLHAGDADLAALHRQLTDEAAARGLTVSGRSLSADPVLGTVALRYGPVTAVLTPTREAPRAH